MAFSDINEIFEIVKDYITDPKSEGAVYINGKWGIGKSYFVFNELKPRLESLKVDCESTNDMTSKGVTILNGSSLEREIVLLNKYNKQATKKYKVIGISLNGIEKCDEINKLLINAALLSKHKNKNIFSKNSIGNFNLASKLVSGIASYVGISLDKLPKIEEFYRVNNCVIIFDDFERCRIEIRTLLGYINSFSEYKNVKVIVIGNEEKIEEKRKQKNIEKDDVENDIKNDKKTVISYDDIKEKAFYIQIDYKPKLEQILIEIFKNYSGSSSLNTFLVKNAGIIIEFLDKNDCCNLRTIFYSLRCFEKTFLLITKRSQEILIESEGITNENYNQSILGILFQYFICSVMAREYRQLKEIDWYNYLIPQPSLEYISTHVESFYFNEAGSLKELVDFFCEEYYRFRQLLKNQNDGLYKLKEWYKLKDEDELKSCLENVYENLEKEGYYSLDENLEIIRVLGGMQGYNLLELDILDSCTEKIIKTFISNKNVLENDHPYLLRKLRSLIIIGEQEPDSPEHKYYSYYTKIQKAIDDADNLDCMKEITDIINGPLKEWSQNLSKYCNENHSYIYDRKAFLSEINMVDLIQKIELSNNHDLWLLRECLCDIYHSGSKSTFSKDVDAIKQFMNYIDACDIPDKLVKNTLKWIRGDLERFLENKTHQ